MIKNLPLQLNEAGKIKIGIKGELTTSLKGNEYRPPQKLDHFILTTTEKNDAGDYVIDTALIDRIKENGTGLVNDDGNLVGIPVRLLYDDIEMNFHTRYACYASRKLSCYGDGEKSFRRIDDYKKEYPCPCNRLDPDYDGDQKCKANGRLICMIDEAGLFGQVHVFRTTSINSVKGIWGGMELIKVATKGRLAGVSLMLTLTARNTDKGTVYVVSVCFNGTMDALRDSVHAMAVKEQVYFLDTTGAGSIVEPGTEDEHEFVEEFYPDVVTTNKSREVSENVQTKHESTYQNHTDKTGTEKLYNARPDSTADNAENISHTCEQDGCEKLAYNGSNDGRTGKAETEQIKQTEATKKTVPKGTQTKPGVTPTINIEFRLLKESCSYNTLYNRFITALSKEERDDALKIAPRLDKDRLEMFFSRERPDIPFRNPKPLKTDYLDKLTAIINSPGPVLIDRVPGDRDNDGVDTEEHPFLAEIRMMEDREQIAKSMAEFFKPIPVNLTLDRDGLIAWAEQRIGVDHGHDEKEHESPVNNDSSNNSEDPGTTMNQTMTPESKPTQDLFPYNSECGPITEDQLRTIVKLKNKLEKKGLLFKENWPGVIAEFATKDGVPMDTATSFCFDQGFELIERLNAELSDDEREPNVPF